MTDRPYDLAIALNYYAPYVSGLTEVARVVAESAAAQGARVVVVASQHDRSLPRTERLNGVTVVRTPVVARIGKGTVSPALLSTAVRAARRARVLHLHLPMLEAGPIALASRASTPVVLTYHCDVSLPPGRLNRLQTVAVDASSRAAIAAAARIIFSSDDYREHSRMAGSVGNRAVAVPPPCLDRSGGTPAFRETSGLHVGFLGRIVEEKGLEFLVDGFRALEDPQARLLIGGDHTRIAGGSVVEEVRRRMGDDPRIRLLGFLPDDALADFYASLDVFALPSVNSFEAFGIVQVEAMMQGVPALASDLPGVRTPVQETGFGVVVAPGDADAVTRGLLALAAAPPDATAGAAGARMRYGTATSVAQYTKVFDEVSVL